MKILVSISGASGSIYGIRLIENLLKFNIETHLIISEEAMKIIEYETDYKTKDLKEKVDYYYDNNDFFSAPASGSFEMDAMIIVPCSMKTLSSIANGFGDTLISRAASCFLKENRKLVLVIRETPLDLPGIKNMKLAKESGAVLLPAMPAFYNKPRKIDDVINFIVGKILDQIKIKHDIFKRWK